jgi:hypothetical protein
VQLFDRGYTEKDDVLTTLAPRIREMDERHLDTTVGRMPMRLVHDEGSDTGSSFSARNRVSCIPEAVWHDYRAPVVPPAARLPARSCVKKATVVLCARPSRALLLSRKTGAFGEGAEISQVC